MYFPEFSITTNILKYIGQIEAAKAVLEVTPIVPALKHQLQREADVKSIFGACHFEGNPLTYEQTKGFFDGKKFDSSKRAFQELNNYKEALACIKTTPKTTEATIKNLHKVLLKDIAPDNKTGLYRTTSTQIKNTNFVNPMPDEILAQMRSFLDWLDSTDGIQLPAPIRSVVTLFEVLRIAPFETENKKIASLLAFLTLTADHYTADSMLELESYFNESPTTFYNIIRSVQNADGDITHWIEYVLLGLSVEFSKLKERIQNLAKDNRLRLVAGMTPLNDRQERILEYLQDYGFLQNKDFVKLFPEVSEDSILRDLKDLATKNLVIKTGSTKSAKYSIKVNQSEQM